MEHVIMENVVYWVIILVMTIGATVCLCAGLVMTIWITWQTVEFVCRHFGWTRQLIEASRRILMERRTKWPAK